MSLKPQTPIHLSRKVLDIGAGGLEWLRAFPASLSAASEVSDKRVYEPQIRAHLGTTAQGRWDGSAEFPALEYRLGRYM